MLKCLYIAPNKATFVLKDIKLLSKYYNVTLNTNKWFQLSSPINYIKQFFYLLFSARKYDFVVIMFAGHWSIIPTIMGKFYGKPVFIILGGTDSVSYPELNYGSLRKKILKKVIQISLQKATALLPVDETLVYFQNTYFNNSQQGIKFFFPNIATPIHTVYNGYMVNANINAITKAARISGSFITVAQVDNFTRFTLKGLDLVINNANNFPNCKFTIIGINETISRALKSIPENVTIYQYVESKQLTEYYLNHEYVIQCSISEGFPNALAEAMSYGCIPIVSNVGAMPKIIDNIGFIVENRDNQYFTNSINAALALTEEEKSNKRMEVHQRIINTFNEDKRTECLHSIFSKYLTNKNCCDI